MVQTEEWAESGESLAPVGAPGSLFNVIVTGAVREEWWEVGPENKQGADPTAMHSIQIRNVRI